MYFVKFGYEIHTTTTKGYRYTVYWFQDFRLHSDCYSHWNSTVESIISIKNTRRCRRSPETGSSGRHVPSCVATRWRSYTSTS